MKAIIFDFDGTLTKKNDNIWKRMWQCLGNEEELNSCRINLFARFINREITHKQWCDLTLKAFQEKSFTKQMLDIITDDMSLIQGAENLIKYLHAQGIELHIVSGGIKSVIKKVLGSNCQYFSVINANEILFDIYGNITEIIATKYDHEGKATYIKELCEKKGYKPNEVLFVGNGFNDEWVYKSGVGTLCVNPDNTKSENYTIWNKVIYTDNLMDLAREAL